MSYEICDSSNARKERFLDDFLLGLNLGSGLFIAGLILVLNDASSIPNFDDSAYLASRSVYRVSDFLHFHPVSAVPTGTLRREFPGRTDQIASEITVILSGLAVIAVIFLLLRLSDDALLCRRLRRIATLPALLFAGPVLFLTISW